MLVYKIKEGPEEVFEEDGTSLWALIALCSETDNGAPFDATLCFETKDNALAFNAKVWNEMEPVKVGEDHE
jgi:hypothetical protein